MACAGVREEEARLAGGMREHPIRGLRLDPWLPVFIQLPAVKSLLCRISLTGKFSVHLA